jgi:hypothetical protein
LDNRACLADRTPRTQDGAQVARGDVRVNAALALALWGCDLLLLRAGADALASVYLAAMTGLGGLV